MTNPKTQCAFPTKLGADDARGLTKMEYTAVEIVKAVIQRAPSEQLDIDQATSLAVKTATSLFEKIDKTKS